MSNWEKKSFQDAPIEIIDGDRGVNYPQKSDFSKAGYCLFLSTSNVTTTGFDFNSTDFISKEKDDDLRKGKLKKGDIVLTTRGTVGNVAFYNEKIPYENIRINSGMILLRADTQKIHPYYLYSFLKSNLFKKQVISQGSGSAQPQLPIGSLKNIVIPWLDLETQQKIAAVLSSLDSKIELNNKINAELEAMAKTLYDYWFVQFDFPDSDGKPYKTSGGKMVWNDELKRDVPEGWEVVRLETISNIFDSKRIPLSSMEREKMKGIYPYYGATGIFDYIDEYIFDGNYILIAEDGSVMGDDGLAIVQYIWGKTWVNNHAHVLQHKELENNEYLFYVLKSISVVQVMTGSIQKKINQENLMNVKIALPDNKTLKLFSEFTEPMRQKIINIIEENKTLSELRDWLLPMLMNGQVRVDI